MSESCTIYCKVLNLQEVSHLLHVHFPIFTSSNDIDEPTVVEGSIGTFQLTPMVFREPGDNFSRLINTTCVFLEGLKKADSNAIARLVSHIEACELLLGVVAKPSFDSDERYDALVFAIAKALDGFVFNGDEMLDADGNVVIVSN